MDKGWLHKIANLKSYLIGCGPCMNIFNLQHKTVEQKVLLLKMEHYRMDSVWASEMFSGSEFHAEMALAKKEPIRVYGCMFFDLVSYIERFEFTGAHA